MRLGHVVFPGSLLDIVATEYAKRGNEAVEGKVEMRAFHSSQLGTDEQRIKGIEVGAPERFVPSTIVSTVDQTYGVFEMPCIIVSRAHMKRVSEPPEVKKALMDGLPRQGIRVIGVWENCVRRITNNVRPITKPEDLKGIKLRVPSGHPAGEDVQGLRRQPPAHGLRRGLLGAPVRRDGGPGEPAGPDLVGEVPRGAEVPLAHRPRVQPGLHRGERLLLAEAPARSAPGDEALAVERGDSARTTGERPDRERPEKMVAGGKIEINEVDKEAFTKAPAAVSEEFGKEVPGGAPSS